LSNIHKLFQFHPYSQHPSTCIG